MANGSAPATHAVSPRERVQAERREHRDSLLRWLSDTLDCHGQEYTHISQVQNGVAFCQLLHVLRPGVINLSLVNSDAFLEFECLHNYWLLMTSARSGKVKGLNHSATLTDWGRLATQEGDAWDFLALMQRRIERLGVADTACSQPVLKHNVSGTDRRTRLNKELESLARKCAKLSSLEQHQLEALIRKAELQKRSQDGSVSSTDKPLSHASAVAWPTDVEGPTGARHGSLEPLFGLTFSTSAAAAAHVKAASTRFLPEQSPWVADRTPIKYSSRKKRSAPAAAASHLPGLQLRMEAGSLDDAQAGHVTSASKWGSVPMCLGTTARRWDSDEYLDGDARLGYKAKGYDPACTGKMVMHM